MSVVNTSTRAGHALAVLVVSSWRLSHLLKVGRLTPQHWQVADSQEGRRSDDEAKRRVEQASGLPFAFELAVA